VARTQIIEHSIDIDAPKQRVWNVLSCLENFDDYSPMVRDVTMLTEQTSGVGSERRCDAYSFGGVEERVTDWDEGHRISLEVIGGMPIEGTAVWTVTGPQPTTVNFRFEYTPKYGPLGFLMDRMMLNRVLSKGLQSNLVGLKVHIEDGSLVTNRVKPASG
jgi:uncharacterized membrane protein